MKRVLLGLASLIVLGVPPAAQADLAVVGKQHESTGYSLVANDESGEANDVDVVYDPDHGAWLINDEAGIGQLAAECSRTNATRVACPAASFQILKIETGGGSDDVTVLGPYANAGPANRFIPVAVGLGRGRDEFHGGRGTNLVIGGPGRDALIGGHLSDSLVGGPGQDHLNGRAGRDFLRGMGGPDKLYGGPGVPDLMVGGKARDLCVGDPRDRVAGCERISVKRH